MPIYTPTQPLPQRNFSKVWNTLTTHVSKTGTELSRFVRTFQLGLGRDVDNVDPSKWVAEMVPLLRLDLVGGASEGFNQATSKTMTAVNVTLAIVGTNVGSIADFWEAFVAHLYPGTSDRTFYSAMYALQVMHYSVSQPAFSPVVYSDTQGIQATGRITMNYEFSTRI